MHYIPNKEHSSVAHTGFLGTVEKRNLSGQVLWTTHTAEKAKHNQHNIKYKQARKGSCDLVLRIYHVDGTGTEYEMTPGEVCENDTGACGVIHEYTLTCSGGGGSSSGGGSSPGDEGGSPSGGGPGGGGTSTGGSGPGSNTTMTSPLGPNGEAETTVVSVILSPDFIEQKCLYGIYQAMGEAPKFQEYLQRFEPTGSLADLKFSVDGDFKNTEPSKYHNAMAITKPPLINNKINIKFNTDPNTAGNILNQPDVFKAVAMIHEMLHAEMYRKMLDAMVAIEGTGATLDWTNFTREEFDNYLNTLENKYFGIWDYYVRYNDNDATPDNGQHQQMAEHYRDVVKQALTDYDPTLTEAQKEALSWLGLNEANIVAWQNYTNKNAVEDTLTHIKNTYPNGCN